MFYPQIYIPFFDDLKNRKILTNGRKNTRSEPVVVIYTGDETNVEYPGYILNEQGVLEDVGFLVDENYAAENEVWVISVNESVDNDGEIDQSYGTRNIANGRQLGIVRGQFTDLAWACDKETWAGGKSEMHILRTSTWSGTRNPSNGRIPIIRWIGTSNAKGARIRKFNCCSGDWEWRRGINWRYGAAWDDDNGTIMAYVIFEKDWTGRYREAAVPIPGGGTSFMAFRSNNSSYIEDVIGRDNIGHYRASNNCIQVFSGTY